MADSDWSSWLEALRGNGEQMQERLLRADDAQQRAEASVALMGLLSKAYPIVFETDADNPHWVPLYNSHYHYGGGMNPDANYLHCPVSDDGIYRITGNRGTVLNCFLTVTVPMWPFTGSINTGRALAEIDIDDFDHDEDGEFELILSPAPVDGYDGAWRELPKGSGGFSIRAVAYDWNTERDPVLTIERLDRPVSRPRMTRDELTRRSEILGRWPARETAQWMPIINDLRKSGLVNELRLRTFGEIAGIPSQSYYEGLFEFAEDEALIFSAPVPEQAMYWNVTLTDELYDQLDFVSRQGSINGFQANVDADGHFRAVISAEDPGVPNWLDTAGLYTGSILGRWNRCSSHPIPKLRRVPLAEVRQHLPGDTPHVSPSERQAALRHRLRGVQRRRRS